MDVESLIFPTLLHAHVAFSLSLSLSLSLALSPQSLPLHISLHSHSPNLPLAFHPLALGWLWLSAKFLKRRRIRRNLAAGKWRNWDAFGFRSGHCCLSFEGHSIMCTLIARLGSRVGTERRGWQRVEG
eukprot:218481-Amorphochlora_amoeboformis.AAC.1